MGNSIFLGVAEVILPVREPAKSAKWYVDFLGFTVIYIEDEEALLKISSISNSHIRLIKTKEPAIVSFPENNVNAVSYYRFISPNFDVTIERMKKLGIKVELLKQRKKRAFSFTDIDGNVLSVCE